MIEQFEKCGIEIILKDFSLNNLLPVVGVIFINSSIRDPATLNYLYEQIQITNGSSFNITEAIIRCFTEHFSLVNLDKNSKGFTERTEELFRKLEKSINIETTTYRGLIRRGRFAGDKTFLLQGEKSPCPTFLTSNNLLDYITQIKAICRKLNTDFIVVDQTHPILRFPTVRVIMPGFSDILNYNDRDFEEIKNYLAFGVSNEIIKQRYLPNFNTTTKENLQALEKSLLYTIINIGDCELEHISNELNSAKNSFLLLSSIYFHRGEYHKFIIMAEKISKSFGGSLGRKYKYLELLTKFYLKTKNKDYQTILIETYQKMIGCHRYLVNAKSNPFINWCDQPCEKDCEKKYRQALKKAITSFFDSKQSNSTMIPLGGL